MSELIKNASLQETKKEVSTTEERKIRMIRMMEFYDKILDLSKKHIITPSLFDMILNRLSNEGMIRHVQDEEQVTDLKKREERDKLLRLIENSEGKYYTLITYSKLDRGSFKGHFFETLPKIKRNINEKIDQERVKPTTERQEKIVESFDKSLKKPRHLIDDLKLLLNERIISGGEKNDKLRFVTDLLWSYVDTLSQAMRDKDINKVEKLKTEIKNLELTSFGQKQYEKTILEKAKEKKLIEMVSAEKIPFNKKDQAKKLPRPGEMEFNYRHWERELSRTYNERGPQTKIKTYLHIDTYKFTGVKRSKIDLALFKEFEQYARIIEPLEIIRFLIGQRFERLKSDVAFTKKVQGRLDKPTRANDLSKKEKKKEKKRKLSTEEKTNGLQPVSESKDYQDQLEALLKKM